MKTGNRFRTDFWYNNVIYSLSGMVAEAIGGVTWENLIKDQIFRPLRMLNTSFYHDRDSTDDFAVSYVNNGFNNTPLKEYILRLGLLKLV